jgi:hypothetical protein
MGECLSFIPLTVLNDFLTLPCTGVTLLLIDHWVTILFLFLLSYARYCSSSCASTFSFVVCPIVNDCLVSVALRLRFTRVVVSVYRVILFGGGSLNSDYFFHQVVSLRFSFGFLSVWVSRLSVLPFCYHYPIFCARSVVVPLS